MDYIFISCTSISMVPVLIIFFFLVPVSYSCSARFYDFIQFFNVIIYIFLSFVSVFFVTFTICLMRVATIACIAILFCRNFSFSFLFPTNKKIENQKSWRHFLLRFFNNRKIKNYFVFLSRFSDIQSVADAISKHTTFCLMLLISNENLFSYFFTIFFSLLVYCHPTCTTQYES